MTAANPLVSTEAWVNAMLACPKLSDLQAARRGVEVHHQKLHSSRMAALTAEEQCRRAEGGPGEGLASRQLVHARNLVEQAERAVQAGGNADDRFRCYFIDLMRLPAPDSGTLSQLAGEMAARGIKVENGVVVLPEGVDRVA